MRYQDTPYFCGPAALQSALKVHRRHVTQRRIAELAGTSESEGTDEAGLMRAALDLGFFVDPTGWSDPGPAYAWLRGSLLEGRPVILCVERWLHWVCAIGHCGPHVLVFEPARHTVSMREQGLLVLNRDRLLRRWRAARRVRGRGGPTYYGIAVGAP